MKITFLEAAVPLTKTFTLVDGVLTKTGHPRIIDCTSHVEEYETIEGLYEHLKHHAALGHSMLKGNVNRKLIMESRAGSTDPNEPTKILLLDLDGVKDVDDVERFLRLLKLHDIDYIVQYSCSMGVIPSRGLSAHIAMLLDVEKSPAILKQWLIHQNLTIPVLRSNVGLTRTNNALRWTLDVSTCQNDKLIYIAPPILGPGVNDSFEGERIQLVIKQKRFASLFAKVPSAEANRVACEKILNDLRDASGLPKRARIFTKSYGAIEYQSNPDQASITGVRTERGFTYLNLNGGDSWGYYHPESNPMFIFNFKGEPTFKTSELLPDYWKDVREKLNEVHPDQKGTYYLALRDFRTATYWNGSWAPRTNELVLAEARGKDQLKDFLKQHGQPVGDFIPDWNIGFLPNEEFIVDLEAKRINTFQPSSFMAARCDDLPDVKEIPPAIKRLILHAMGDDEECLDHMVNWLAVIFKYRCRTETCWILQGVEGTGKGLFLNRVLRPLFKYVVSKRMNEMDSQFNGFLERCLILWIDEMQLSALKSRADSVESDLKNYIVEPMLSIRRMHTMPYEVPNYSNIIIPGNKDDVMHISQTDRRFNVCPYQGARFTTSDEELDQVERELVDFGTYLASYPASKQRARTALNNDAKGRMTHITAPGLDEVCKEVLRGNLQFFWDQRPAMSIMDNSSADVMAGRYLGLLMNIAKGQKETILREELQILMGCLLGNVPVAPYKFTSLLKHHKIFLTSLSRDGKYSRGIKVQWNISVELKKEILGGQQNELESSPGSPDARGTVSHRDAEPS